MFMTQKLSLAFFVAAATLAAQTPTITAVVNAASNIPPGSPNFGVAQGSIFVLYGTNFGPTALSQPSALPWPTVFAGTSVTVSQGKNVFNVPIIYVVNNQAGGYSQLGGIMPSATTPGSATVQLTYNNAVSNAFTTTILANGFGISTVNEAGQGQAVITYPTATAPYYGLVSRKLVTVLSEASWNVWITVLGDRR